MKILFTVLFSISFQLVYAQFELDSLKSKWIAEGREDIEGVYSLASGTNAYSIVLAKDDDVYKLVYIEGKQSEWLYGDLKAIIAPSEEKIYEGRWNAGVPAVPLLEDIKIVFGDKKFILYWSDWSIDEFKMTFPENSKNKDLAKKSFDDALFTRNHISVPIQRSDSGLVEIPLLINDVLKIYVGLERTSAEVIISKDIVSTLIQTKTVGYNEWVDGNYYEFIDPKKSFNGPHTFTISSLKIGTRELKDVRAKVSDKLSRAMVINIDVLEQLGKINIDLENNILTITK
jgi:hypothetical protein